MLDCKSGGNWHQYLSGACRLCGTPEPARHTCSIERCRCCHPPEQATAADLEPVPRRLGRPRGSRSKITPAVEAEIRRRLEAGATVASIATATGVSARAIRRRRDGEVNDGARD